MDGSDSRKQNKVCPYNYSDTMIQGFSALISRDLDGRLCYVSLMPSIGELQIDRNIHIAIKMKSPHQLLSVKWVEKTDR